MIYNYKEEVRCSVCDKLMIVASKSNYLYKTKKKVNGIITTLYQCSHSHWKQAGGDKGYGIDANDSYKTSKVSKFNQKEPTWN